MAAAHEPIGFWLNQHQIEEQAAPGEVMLDVIRRGHRLTGTKDACRAGDCGACMVLLGRLDADSRLSYAPANACLLPLGAALGCHVVTIEGLGAAQANPIQQALVDQGGIQCGFCTPGLVIALTAFFLNSESSDVEAAIDAVAGNLCRCTGYSGIKRAIGELCERFDLRAAPMPSRIQACIDWRMLPPYFADMPARLADARTPAPGLAQSAINVAGGTDLFVRQAEQLRARPLHFLKPMPGGEAIRLQEGLCTVDAATTIERLRTDSALRTFFPTLGDDFRLICSASVRQRATVGGNLANASPIGDLAVFFLALDARLDLAGGGQTRSLRLRDFFKAYKQIDCGPDEVIQAIRFDLPAPSAAFSFEKLAKRTYLDIASVNSAMSVEVSNGVIARLHLSAGGVAPTPLYLTKTREYLLGKTVSPKTVRQAAVIAQSEIAPIDDVRGSVEYKRLLLRQLIFAHFLKLFPERLSWEALDETA